MIIFDEEQRPTAGSGTYVASTRTGSTAWGRFKCISRDVDLYVWSFYTV